MKVKLSVATLLLISVIWGFSYFFIQATIDRGISVSFLMSSRFILAALLILLVSRGKALKKTNIKNGLMGGLFVFLGFFLQNTGQKTANISSVALFTATNVMMIPLLRWLFYKKRPDLRTLFCCFLGFLGVAVISYQKGQAISLNAGEMLVLAGAFFFALHMVFLDSRVRITDTESFMFWQMLFAGLYGAVVTVASNEVPSISLVKAGLVPVLYVGLLATGFSYLMQAKAQINVSAALTGMILSLECIFGAAFSVLLGYEAFRIQLLIGSLLIMSSIFIMENKIDDVPVKAEKDA